MVAGDISQIVENASSRNVEESFQKFLDADPDDFENVICSSLSIDTSAVNFREDPFGSFYVKLLTDRQTDRQTDKQTNEQTNKQTDRQTNRQTDKQTNRQTDKQANKQTGKQTNAAHYITSLVQVII